MLSFAGTGSTLIPETPKKVLIVLHGERSTPGRIGKILQTLGFALEVRRPPLGCELPAGMNDYAGVVVFGGPMSANDDVDWLCSELEWLGRVLDANIPFLGLCLGAQLMARRLGARVYGADDRRGEVGYYPLRPTPAGRSLCDEAFPRHAYQWHFEGFELPPGASRLAEGSDDFPNQAYVYRRNVVGLQFHPEVTYQMMCRWTMRGVERLARPGAHPRNSHLEGWFEHDRAVAKWTAAFLRAWIADKLNVDLCEFPCGYAVAAE